MEAKFNFFFKTNTIKKIRFVFKFLLSSGRIRSSPDPPGAPGSRPRRAAQAGPGGRAQAGPHGRAGASQARRWAQVSPHFFIFIFIFLFFVLFCFLFLFLFCFFLINTIFYFYFYFYIFTFTFQTWHLIFTNFEVQIWGHTSSDWSEI